MSAAKLTMESVMKGIKRARSSWIDDQMRQLLPKHRYRQAHSPDAMERMQALKWTEEQGYKIVDEGEEILIKKGFKVLARTKMLLEVKSPEEMIELAKVARLKQAPK